MGSWINPCASMNPFFSLGSWVKFGTELHRLDGLLGRNTSNSIRDGACVAARARAGGRAPPAGRCRREGPRSCAAFLEFRHPSSDRAAPGPTSRGKVCERDGRKGAEALLSPHSYEDATSARPHMRSATLRAANRPVRGCCLLVALTRQTTCHNNLRATDRRQRPAPQPGQSHRTRRDAG